MLLTLLICTQETSENEIYKKKGSEISTKSTKILSFFSKTLVSSHPRGESVFFDRLSKGAKHSECFLKRFRLRLGRLECWIKVWLDIGRNYQYKYDNFTNSNHYFTNSKPHFEFERLPPKGFAAVRDFRNTSYSFLFFLRATLSLRGLEMDALGVRDIKCNQIFLLVKYSVDFVSSRHLFCTSIFIYEVPFSFKSCSEDLAASKHFLLLDISTWLLWSWLFCKI